LRFRTFFPMAFGFLLKGKNTFNHLRNSPCSSRPKSKKFLM
jgi:hypothetical protein